MTDEWELADAYGLDFFGFVLVESGGGCSYETKARNVEAMGGQAVIIIEN